MSVQPTPRRSTRLAAKTQAVPSFADLPQLALSAIHDTLMRWSKNSQEFIECTRAQDAAAFRSTCKAFNGAAMLPRALKLKFSKPPSLEATQSLATMLSKPVAANTQLSFWLSNKSPSSDQAWVHRLGLAGLRVVTLKMPCRSINGTLAAMTFVPGLESVTLYVSSATEAGVPLSHVSAWLSASLVQLRTLSLVIPPGHPPFHLRGSSASSPFLNLSGLPALRQLRLVGPIVKDSSDFKLNDVPFVLPPSAKVLVDPNLGQREPTPWACGRKLCWMAHKFRGKSIPSSQKYKEEDLASRRKRMNAFTQRVSRLACKEAQDRGLTDTDGVKGFVLDCFLSDGALEDMMLEAGIEGRSDLLESRLCASVVADEAVDVYFEEEESEDGMCPCCGGYCC